MIEDSAVRDWARGRLLAELTDSRDTVEEIMASDELQSFMISDSKEAKERCGTSTLRSFIVKMESAALQNAKLASSVQKIKKARCVARRVTGVDRIRGVFGRSCGEAVSRTRWHGKKKNIETHPPRSTSHPFAPLSFPENLR